MCVRLTTLFVRPPPLVCSFQGKTDILDSFLFHLFNIKEKIIHLLQFLFIILFILFFHLNFPIYIALEVFEQFVFV